MLCIRVYRYLFTRFFNPSRPDPDTVTDWRLLKTLCFKCDIYSDSSTQDTLDLINLGYRAVGSVVYVTRLSCFGPPRSGFTPVQFSVKVKL